MPDTAPENLEQQVTAPQVAEKQPAPAETAAAPETTVSPKAAKLVALGFENVSSDDEAFDRLVSAYQQQREAISSELQEIKQALVHKEEPKPQVTGERKPWQAPRADLAAASKYRNQDGTWKPETPTDLRSQVEAYERHRAEFAERLLADPEAAIGDLMREIARKEYEHLHGQITAQQTEAQFFQKAITENDWLFEKNPHTGKADPRRLTGEGEKFNELMSELETGGMGKVQAFQTAMRLYRAEQAAFKAQQPTPQQAQQVREQKQKEVLARGLAAPGRNGSLAHQPEKRTTNLRPGQKFIQNLQADGAGV